MRFTLKKGIKNILSSLFLLTAISTVNSACSFYIYEEKMPEEANMLLKR